MKLSEREKILLVVLAFMLLNVIGIQFILTPMQQKYEDLVSERAQIEDELAQQQLMIDMLDALNQDHEDLVVQLQNLADRFVPPKYSELKDEYLYETMADFIKQWDSLTISDLTYAMLPGSEHALSVVLMVEADFTVTGSMDQMIGAMDKIQQLPQVISITSLSVNEKEKQMQGSFHIQFYTFND